jgi:ribosomal protein L11 methyltransferase
VRVPLERAEEARAQMLELVPEGFEERERAGELELAAYTDGIVAVRIARAFGAAQETDVPDDWADRWRTFHAPVRAGPFWVGPTWEGAPADAIPMVIDPGLAFGTGAHATTRLCLELLPALARGGLLDVGCGSGVLSVAAAKLGFAPVHAVDDDPLAVETTRANAERNGADVAARVADARSAALPAADVVVANIALAVVEALAPRIEASEFVTSGYLAAERPRLPEGWEHVETRTLEGWAADRFRHP